MPDFSPVARRLAAAAAVVAGLAALATPAAAVPSFSRQTGQECAACHIGAYGPNLTPYGIRFKLNGYTEATADAKFMPFSGMVVGTFTHTAKGQPQDSADRDFKDNDNAVMQEASLFLAGKLTDHVGAFVQGTYSGVDKRASLDNADIRATTNVNFAGYDILMGLSANNNPTLSDPFNTLGAWRFPFISSDLAPGPDHAPMLAGGLEQRVWGASAYAFINDSFYVEAGAYAAGPRHVLEKLNDLDKADLGQNVVGLAPYGRLAYMKDMKTQAFTVGIVGFAPQVRSYDATGAKDRYTDLGVDASYTWLGNRQHIFTLAGSYVREWQSLGETWDGGAGADSKSQTLDELSLTASYTYDKTWGLSARAFSITGSSDATLYAGTGKPDTTGVTFQADWTPFGKETSWAAPNANLRLGLQYTLYGQFDGARTNYDGNGRNASDNNTLMAFAAVSF